MWPNRSGVPIIRESDALTKTGEKLRIVWNTNIVRDEQGNAMYAVMTGIDVTAERTTAGLVNHLMEASLTTAIVGIDTAGRITRRQLRHPAPARLRARRAGRRAVPPAAQARGAAGADRCRHPRRGVRHPGARAGPGRRDPRPRLDLDDQGRRRAAGLDDHVGGPGRVRRAERLPLRRPRRDRAAAQPGDADRRARQGAHRRGAAPRARPGQERVRLDGLPRAAHAGHEHRRLHRDARPTAPSSTRCPTSSRCWRPSTATASG